MTAILGRGTAEARWQQWGRLGTLPLVSAADLGPDLLVVAPHPDDEVLGAGGLLALAGGEVVAVTDGEASHPRSDAVDPADLVAARRAETAVALGLLGRGAGSSCGGGPPPRCTASRTRTALSRRTSWPTS